MQTPRALLLFAHPFPHRSRANLALRRAVEGHSEIRIHDLYETYPDFFIDIAREQQLLRESELIIFQHPLYWYSAPAMLKQWQDCVLQPGFAFGAGEKALAGKRLMVAVTTGHRAAYYSPEGYDHYTIEEFLRPTEQTARHCGMHYLPPFVLHHCHKLEDQELAQQAAAYRRILLDLLAQPTPDSPHG